jgi:hypothetical protein
MRYTQNLSGYLRGGKISPRLSEAIEEIDRQIISRNNLQEDGLENLSTELVRIDERGMIELYIHCNEAGDENLNRLTDLGLETEVINDELKIIQGWLPHDVIEEASELGFVKEITPPSYGRTRTGSVTNEADSIIGADMARAEFGVSGFGVKIGVISDGVDSLSQSQATGDLPPFVQVGLDGNPGDDEGTAILEIIYDIAPGADLAFHTGNSTLKFIQAVEFFSNNGVDIIVDDIGYLDEPYFQDGSVAQAAAAAVSQGIIFVSAAGNDQDRHYQALYVDVDPGDAESNNHDYGKADGGPSRTRMMVEVPPNGVSVVVLQWSDPFGESSNDYDLFLVDPSDGTVLDSSTRVQDGDDDPIESAGVINSGSISSGVFEIVIDKFSGKDQTLEIYFNGNGQPTEFNVPEDSIYGHPAHPDVIAVGATFEGSVEFFSSFGPSSIFFDPVVTVSSRDTSAGSSPLRAADLLEARPKPDISAPNGLSTTVPGFFKFFVTSAAAPVVAGAAALVFEALNYVNTTTASRDETGFTSTRQTPEEVRVILTGTANDIFPGGFDTASGAGIVDAFAAVQQALAGSSGPGDGGGGGNGDGGGNPGDGNGQGNNGGGGGGAGCSLYSGAQSGFDGNTAILNILILLIPALLVTLNFIRRRI